MTNEEKRVQVEAMITAQPRIVAASKQINTLSADIMRELTADGGGLGKDLAAPTCVTVAGLVMAQYLHMLVNTVGIDAALEICAAAMSEAVRPTMQTTHGFDALAPEKTVGEIPTINTTTRTGKAIH